MKESSSSAGVYLGYRRASGEIGFRNKVLILSATGLTGPSVRRIADSVPNTHCISYPYGTGLTGHDRLIHHRAIEGLACNPNVGACLLICDNRPLGDELSDRIRTRGQLVSTLTMEDVDQDPNRLTTEGITQAVRLLREVSTYSLEEANLSDLRLGLKCGRSDPSSSLAANPAVGKFVDRVVAANGTVIFGEVIEWVGAESLLAPRGIDEHVQRKIWKLPEERERQAQDAGFDLLGANPSSANITSGISTIEEKALGGITKTGASPIAGVLDYGEAPRKKGLFAMDTPSYAPEHLTAMAAGGCQLVIFTTGVGNAFVSGLCPTVKVSANPETCKRFTEQIDVDLAALFQGDMSLTEAADNLCNVVVQIANGMLTWGETMINGEEVISRYGPAL